MLAPVILASLLLAAGELGASADPSTITGGTAALPCAWPSTVAVDTTGGLCSGTLVHPQVVVFAAHCSDAVTSIRVGDHADVAARELAIDACHTNPAYLGVSTQAQDWAFCTLAEAVDDLPLTPPAYGCETDGIVAGAEVVIAGFGQSAAGMGAGPKRWATTHVVTTFGGTANIGGDGASTCPGDSGGSAYLAMADGSWRAISMVSTGVDCGSAAVHALMHPAVPWIESTSGFDITPCHDQDGTWNPGPACTGFYAGDGSETASWDDACASVPRSGAGASCGDAYEPAAGSSDGGSSDGGGTDAGSTEAGAQTSAASASTGAGEDGDSSGGASARRDGGGCGVGARDWGGWGAIAVLVLVFRRRRRA